MKPAILFVSHPGHELRVLRWIETLHPTVFVLTDGSGKSGTPRIELSREIVAETGCVAGSVFGRFSDLDVYRALLTGNMDAIAEATIELADEIIRRDVRSVIADAFEFYNPAHDLCAVMAGLATERARIATGREIDRYEFAVIAPSGEGKTIELDDATVRRKIAIAHRVDDLRVEVDGLLAVHGNDVLLREVLRPLPANAAPPRPNEKPFYEKRGEEQVAAGRYETVLRYESHFAPAVASLATRVQLQPARA